MKQIDLGNNSSNLFWTNGRMADDGKAGLIALTLLSFCSQSLLNICWEPESLELTFHHLQIMLIVIIAILYIASNILYVVNSHIRIWTSCPGNLHSWGIYKILILLPGKCLKLCYLFAYIFLHPPPHQTVHIIRAKSTYVWVSAGSFRFVLYGIKVMNEHWMKESS